MKFASAEYNGQLYMTPQDFIESVTDSEPRSKFITKIFYIITLYIWVNK